MRRRRGVKMLENKDEKLSYLRRRRVRRGIEKIVMLEYGEEKTHLLLFAHNRDTLRGKALWDKINVPIYWEKTV